jgi:hypothetical protein
MLTGREYRAYGLLLANTEGSTFEDWEHTGLWQDVYLDKALADYTSSIRPIWHAWGRTLRSLRRKGLYEGDDDGDNMFGRVKLASLLPPHPKGWEAAG